MDINTLSDKLQYVALYLAVALVAAFIVVGLLVWFFKREKFNDYKKYAIGIATGFAITMVVVFAYVKFQCNIDDMQAKLFYPILATLITAVAGAIAMLVSSLFNDKAVKISLIVTAALLLGCFIATMVLMAQYYGDIAEYYPNANLVGMIVSAVVFMVIMVVMWFVGDKTQDERHALHCVRCNFNRIVICAFLCQTFQTSAGRFGYVCEPSSAHGVLLHVRYEKGTCGVHDLRRASSASRSVHYPPDAILARLSSRVRSYRSKRYIYGKGRV